MAKLGSAVVFITGDTKGLNDALGRSQVVARQSFGNISAAATAAGRKMAVMGAAMTAAFGSMAKTAADFDLAMIESTSIMGDLADSTKQQMRDLALEMSKESKFAANELAKSYYFLAAAGLDAEQSMGALRMVMEFATAGAFDLSRATDLLTDAQSALGMSSKDTSENIKNMQRVSDVLIRANTLANASAQQFSESLTNKAGAALKIVNKDIEEGVAVLAAFADQGIKGAEAGSALGIVMRDLQTKFISATKEGPEQLVEKYQKLAAQLAIAQQKFREMQASGKASESSLMAQAEKVRLLQDQMVSLKDGMENGSKAVNKFGVTVFDAQGNMRNMGDIVADLENALAGMSDEQAKATLLQMGFTDKSVGFIQVLMGTSEKIRDYEKALYEAGGTTKQVSDSQMEAFSNKMLKVGHQIQAVAIEVGTNLMPTIEQFVNESIIPAIRAVGAWVQENKNLIPLLAKVGVALAVGGPILTGLGQGVLLFGKMNAALKVLGPALTSTIGSAAGSMGFLGMAAAVGAVAYGGWQLGRWIDGMIDDHLPALGRAIDWIADKYVAWLDVLKEIVSFGMWDTNTFNAGGELGARSKELLASGAVSRPTGDFGWEARAMGGPVWANKPYLVGENGPEIYVPDRSGTIIPNDKIGGAGGIHIGQMTIVANDPADFERKLRTRALMAGA